MTAAKHIKFNGISTQLDLHQWLSAEANSSASLPALLAPLLHSHLQYHHPPPHHICTDEMDCIHTAIVVFNQKENFSKLFFFSAFKLFLLRFSISQITFLLDKFLLKLSSFHFFSSLFFIIKF